ncbi:hypothetical protein [Kineococcus sp. NUM-3379]
MRRRRGAGALLTLPATFAVLSPPLAWAASSARVPISSSLTVAASFPNHPTVVRNDTPSFQHRFEEAPGAVTAADSSASTSPGVHAGASATWPAPGYLTGSLDEVAVWNGTALTAQQVAWQFYADHRTGGGGSATAPVPPPPGTRDAAGRHRGPGAALP